MTNLPISLETEQAQPTIDRPRLSDWVWRPGHAKLWWSLTAIYWSVGALGFVFRPILDLYMTDAAYVLHVVFFPAFAFALMSFGWIRAWVKALDLSEANSGTVNELGWTWSHERESFQERSSREFWDPTNPFSPLFVGRNTH